MTLDLVFFPNFTTLHYIFLSAKTREGGPFLNNVVLYSTELLFIEGHVWQLSLRRVS